MSTINADNVQENSNTESRSVEVEKNKKEKKSLLKKFFFSEFK